MVNVGRRVLRTHLSLTRYTSFSSAFFLSVVVLSVVLFQDYFIENVAEELDEEGEYYLDTHRTAPLLPQIHVIRPPPASPSPISTPPPTPPKPLTPLAPPGEGEIVAAAMETLVRMKGSSKTTPVHDVRWSGVTFRDARPTFMAAHEATSGGDWAMHRGASVVLENAERVTMVGCTWDGVHGNGLIMSRYVRNCTVTASTFMNIGETAVRRKVLMT